MLLDSLWLPSVLATTVPCIIDKLPEKDFDPERINVPTLVFETVTFALVAEIGPDITSTPDAATSIDCVALAATPKMIGAEMRLKPLVAEFIIA